MKDYIEFLVKELVNFPDDVEVTKNQSGGDSDNPFERYVIKCNNEDLSLLIGKGGQTIRSVRALAKMKAVKEGVYIDIRIEE